MNDVIAAHLEMSIPRGARNIPAMPMSIMSAILGILVKSPSMSSMSLLPMWCSTVPTHRNMRDLVMAWKTVSIIPAQTASGVPTPAQVTIRPRLAIVEYARTLFAFV